MGIRSSTTTRALWPPHLAPLQARRLPAPRSQHQSLPALQSCWAAVGQAAAAAAKAAWHGLPAAAAAAAAAAAGRGPAAAPGAGWPQAALALRAGSHDPAQLSQGPSLEAAALAPVLLALLPAPLLPAAACGPACPQQPVLPDRLLLWPPLPQAPQLRLGLPARLPERSLLPRGQLPLRAAPACCLELQLGPPHRQSRTAAGRWLWPAAPLAPVRKPCAALQAQPQPEAARQPVCRARTAAAAAAPHPLPFRAQTPAGGGAAAAARLQPSQAHTAAQAGRAAAHPLLSLGQTAAAGAAGAAPRPAVSAAAWLLQPPARASAAGTAAASLPHRCQAGQRVGVRPLQPLLLLAAGHPPLQRPARQLVPPAPLWRPPAAGPAAPARCPALAAQLLPRCWPAARCWEWPAPAAEGAAGLAAPAAGRRAAAGS